MPTFECEIVEQVTVRITVEVEAETKEQAAALAHQAWVDRGEGSKYEEVHDRYVEIDGEIIDHDEDE